MDPMKKRPAMPCTYILIAVWVAVWLAVTCGDAAPLLCGKGIAKTGDAYYRFFTAGLTHQHILHLLANVSAMLWIGHLYEHSIGSVPFAAAGLSLATAAQFLFLCIYRNADSSIGGSVYPFAFLGFGLVMQLLVPGFPKITLGTWSGNWLALYGVASSLPGLFAADETALVLHAIALALGAAAGVVYRLLGRP